ncbi:hypothetical protein GCM10010387_31380 [Streptomyces inusitatus]|uniref:Uncharacterized protein n=1 Tax=Streptomyces inusitatus TaxID=68221 RepID=A0A918Q8X4_9ACTN|nr:hypothetical protein GCM10010387_31380 [Streptomyces inusitatus]
MEIAGEGAFLGRDESADVRVPLQQGDRPAGRRQLGGGHQAGCPRAHDGRVAALGPLPLVSPHPGRGPSRPVRSVNERCARGGSARVGRPGGKGRENREGPEGPARLSLRYLPARVLSRSARP